MTERFPEHPGRLDLEHLPAAAADARRLWRWAAERCELTDWFWVAYADAWDWVVEPNVLGMGSFAVGDLFTSKPYVAGANYVDRMSDYCADCRFSPHEDCPITSLYWDFIACNEKRLADNPRMGIPLSSLRRRPKAQRREDGEVARRVRRTLAQGGRLAP